VIAGLFRSRHLKAKPPAGTRPTSDKLRGTLFNILGPSVEGAAFLDACAGMGAIGIEAISRGAAFVCFVDQSRKACASIRENLESLDVKEGYRVLEVELGRALDLCKRDGAVFDIVFVDPPYEKEAVYAQTLKVFGEGALLAAGGLVVLEHSKRVELPETAGKLRRYRVLPQGDSSLSFYRAETL
jgi:16S rRNA (guanine(966)-N(2))-methyltransferase RsmD